MTFPRSRARPPEAHRSWRVTGALCPMAFAAAVGCSGVTVPNYSPPSVQRPTVAPTKSPVHAAVGGMLAALRFGAGPEGRQMCTLGKECYSLISSAGRSLTWITGPIEPGGFIGSLQDMGWAISYRNVWLGAVALEAADKVADFTIPE